jgi:site-specific DNA recombinase
VQSIMDASGTAGERRRSHDHYLKGSLWCARCHTRGTRGRLVLTRATGRHGGEYAYFLCLGRRDGACDLPHLPTEYVEDAVERYWSTQRLSEEFTTRMRTDMQAVLDETTTSRRLLHDQLTTELAAIDRQEENLLDLAADATLSTSKVRTRLTTLQTQRRQIQARLADTDDHLHQGATVLEAQLDLLQRPDELYRGLSDHGRRLLNQAIFDELLIDQDPDDQAIHIPGQTYAEPVRELMTAAHAHRHSSDATNDSRPAVNGGPVVWGTSAGLPTPIQWDRGWNKAAMVELRGFEPLTPSMRTRCATRLRHSPKA